MNSWLVKQCSVLGQPARFAYRSAALSNGLRQISSSSSNSASPNFRANSNPGTSRMRQWEDKTSRPSPLWSSLVQTTSTGSISGDAADIWADRHARFANTMLAPNNTYSGRSILIPNDSEETGVAEAWAKLSSRLKRNNVYADFKRNMRHEKKGYKRRRLESERWRKRFAHEVRQKIQLVQAIRRRGA